MAKRQTSTMRDLQTLTGLVTLLKGLGWGVLLGLLFKRTFFPSALDRLFGSSSLSDWGLILSAGGLLYLQFEWSRRAALKPLLTIAVVLAILDGLAALGLLIRGSEGRGHGVMGVQAAG